ncbi:hypothetical protein Ddc_09098 [Ditylenchus destructor]|nr:hypothetical protein Ddc_09098 [Ditylenchus destructor]
MAAARAGKVGLTPYIHRQQHIPTEKATTVPSVGGSSQIETSCLTRAEPSYLLGLITTPPFLILPSEKLAFSSHKAKVSISTTRQSVQQLPSLLVPNTLPLTTTTTICGKKHLKLKSKEKEGTAAVHNQTLAGIGGDVFGADKKGKADPKAPQKASAAGTHDPN